MDKAFFGKLVHFRRAPGGVSTSIVLADVTAKKTRERERMCVAYTLAQEKATMVDMMAKKNGQGNTKPGFCVREG